MEGMEASYHGQTSRSAYQRGKEHMDGYRLAKQDNPMYKHRMTEHGHLNKHKKVEFEIKVVSAHRTAISRQVAEAASIINNKDEFVMNSKSEYNGVKIPRLVVEVGDKVWTADYNGNTNKRQKLNHRLETGDRYKGRQVKRRADGREEVMEMRMEDERKDGEWTRDQEPQIPAGPKEEAGPPTPAQVAGPEGCSSGGQTGRRGEKIQTEIPAGWKVNKGQWLEIERKRREKDLKEMAARQERKEQDQQEVEGGHQDRAIIADQRAQRKVGGRGRGRRGGVRGGRTTSGRARDKGLAGKGSETIYKYFHTSSRETRVVGDRKDP